MPLQDPYIGEVSHKPVNVKYFTKKNAKNGD